LIRRPPGAAARSRRAEAAERLGSRHLEILLLALERQDQGRLGGRAADRSESAGGRGGQLTLVNRHDFRQRFDVRGVTAEAEGLQTGAGGPDVAMVHGLGKDLAQPRERQIRPKEPDGFFTDFVLHTAGQLRDDGIPFGAHFLGGPQANLGVSIRTGGTQSRDSLRIILSALPQQQDQIAEPHLGDGILQSVFSKPFHHIKRLREPLCGIEETRQEARSLLGAHLRADLAVRDRHVLRAQAEDQTPCLRVEQRADDKLRAGDAERAFELGISPLRRAHPRKAFGRPLDRHSGEHRRLRKQNRDEIWSVLPGLDPYLERALQDPDPRQGRGVTIAE
jgi:hypothetical protein